MKTSICTIATLLIFVAASLPAQEREEKEHKEKNNPSRLIRKGLRKARLGLAEAVLRAKRKVHGQVLSAEFEVEMDDGKLEVGYEVLILRRGKLIEVVVNARNGDIEDIEKKGTLGRRETVAGVNCLGLVEMGDEGHALKEISRNFFAQDVKGKRGGSQGPAEGKEVLCPEHRLDQREQRAQPDSGQPQAPVQEKGVGSLGNPGEKGPPEDT